jgi:hypothetical protein
LRLHLTGLRDLHIDGRELPSETDSASVGLYDGLTEANAEFENVRSLSKITPQVPLVSADTLLIPKFQS